MSTIKSPVKKRKIDGFAPIQERWTIKGKNQAERHISEITIALDIDLQKYLKRGTDLKLVQDTIRSHIDMAYFVSRVYTANKYRINLPWKWTAEFDDE